MNLARRIGYCAYIGTGSERPPQPTKEDIDNGAEIFTVRFVAAEDGRPAEQL